MKPRVPIINVELKEYTQISWDPESSSIMLLDSNGNVSEKNLVSISEGYARKGKFPKILRQLRNPSGSKIVFPLKPDLYDKYFAIDTNFREIGDNLLCVTGCFFINQKIDKITQLRKAESIEIVVVPRLIFLAKKGTKPERYGWMKIIESFAKSKYYDQALSFGVVVDSDMNDLRRIESTEIDIVPGFKLPSNFNLIYASADLGKEKMINRLISAADKVATSTLNATLETARKYSHLQLPKEYCNIGISTDAIGFELKL